MKMTTELEKMADCVSDLESDASSVDGGGPSGTGAGSGRVLSAAVREQLGKRIESLQQENRVLRMELETVRYKCKSLEEENKELKKARVTIVSVSRVEVLSFLFIIYII